jgi:hypothetical protein
MQFVVEVFFWLQIDGSQERYLFTNKMEVIVGKVGFALRGTVETRLILWNEALRVWRMKTVACFKIYVE